MGSFEGKTVIVTGASSGIGAEIALAFAEEGANIMMTYRENRRGAEEIATMIGLLRTEVTFMKADLRDEKHAARVISKTIDEYGRLDVLVNNAGRYIDGDEWFGAGEVWSRSLEQNLLSAMHMSKYAAEAFLKLKSGVIVNISSRYSVAGQHTALAYSASKAGMVSLTQAYAKLLAPFGRANAISPGPVNTGYWTRAPKEEVDSELSEIPLGKFAEPRDIADCAVFLASDKAKHITGQNILIDGGAGLR